MSFLKKLFSSKSKKGFTLAQIPNLAIVFGLGVIILSIVGDIVSNVQDTQTTNSTSYNISGKGLEGIGKVANWYPTIGTVIGAAIIITALFFLWKGGGGTGEL